MCRLIAIPPGFKRNDALDILSDMERANTDGTGEAYVKDGHFIINKYPYSLTKVLRDKQTFLNHLPYNGWTVAHIRAKTHGDKNYENTHPFLDFKQQWAIAHNGVWYDSKIVRLALSNYMKFEGQTDSEVAAKVIGLIGPKKFAEEISFGGVYLCLNIDGHLEALKTSFSGDLSIHVMKNNKFLLASEFPPKSGYEELEAYEGWYKFNKEGNLESVKKTTKVFNEELNFNGITVSGRFGKFEETNFNKDKESLRKIGEFGRKITTYYSGYED